MGSYIWNMLMISGRGCDFIIQQMDFMFHSLLVMMNTSIHIVLYIMDRSQL